jgi:hypothetical protein
MNETTLLYALSTLAQTCAALAAFIGAVGLYRLQQLHSERWAVYEDIYAQLGRPTETREQVLQRALTRPEPSIAANLTRHADLEKRVRRVVVVLVLFELWQMGAILFSLLAFYSVSPLSQSVVWSFAIASIGAVLSTMACVVVWAWPTAQS